MLQCEDEEAIFPCGHYDLNRYQWLGFSSARPRHMRENRSVGFSHNYDHCTHCSVNITPPTSSIKLMKSMSRKSREPTYFCDQPDSKFIVFYCDSE